MGEMCSAGTGTRISSSLGAVGGERGNSSLLQDVGPVCWEALTSCLGPIKGSTVGVFL